MTSAPEEDKVSKKRQGNFLLFLDWNSSYIYARGTRN